MGSLDGRKAVVAGGGKGIGRAIALAFAAEGADVAVVGRSEESLVEVADAIRGAGRRAVAAPQDLTRVG
ncbi:MAG TPA: SDR family NAD(P)-dependent oxidoreductase, partial [Acidimicrobiia bacterium]|nr:SDR family NAD(P)-dependent oxidoreductase [Acidimicrobiia bacterium]